VLAAPGDAVALATGSSQPALAFGKLMSAASGLKFPVLIRLAEDSSIIAPVQQGRAIEREGLATLRGSCQFRFMAAGIEQNGRLAFDLKRHRYLQWTAMTRLTRPLRVVV